VFLKGDKIEQDAECNFEQNLARKFVRETKLHGDPVHYTRALAMQGEVKARLGKYEEALAAFEKLKAVYIQEEHSEAISSAYGTDRSAQAYSQSALWHMQLGNMAEALQTCNYVLDVLLPKMDPKNVLNSCEMLLPIIRILKNRGEEKRMRRLFHEHVQENFHRHFGKDGVTPCLPIFRPLLLLLDICNEAEECPDLADGVEWLLEDEANGDMPDFLDSVYVKLCWSPNSMVAELCLRLAKKLTSDRDKIALLVKGLKLARKADGKMKDEEGNVKLPIAYEIHEPVYTELKSMAEMYGVQLGDGTISFGEQTSHIDPINLPCSYLRHHTSSDRSTGEGTSSRSDSTPNCSVRRISSTRSLKSSGRLESSSVLESLNEEEGE
jgi:tetratricopeptide (TPR) repeat protein